MYTMKDICQKANINYETLKYYCNQGLIPNIKRDKNNHRIFDEHDLAWIKDLTCLKKCRLSINEMKYYLNLCLEGPSSIPIRQKFIAEKKEALLVEIAQLNDYVKYIEWKETLYSNIQSGKQKYVSNLIKRYNE